MADIDPSKVKWDAPIDPKMVKWDDEKSKTAIAQDIKQGAGNLAAGAIRGAGSIGATLLAPYDAVKGVVTGELDLNDKRRQGMDSALQGMGAQPESLMFQGGKLGGEIAGTAGAGGLLANGLRATGVAAPKVLTALESGGFRTTAPSFVGPQPAATLASRAGDMALRTAAGGAVGGASAALVDPSQAGTGAMVGAAMPGAIKTAGVVGGKVADLAGSATKNLLGLSTGAGGNAVSTALQAGKNGDRAFLDNMRGNVPLTDVLDEAKTALTNMRIARGNEYRQGMAGVSADKTVLNMQPIEAAVNSIKSMGSYKGQQINKNAAGTVDEIAKQVGDWAKLNPKDYHTPEGLDALKKAVGDIRDATEFGSAGRKAADTVYNAIKSEISMQAPTYAKTMKSYSEASDLITEIEKALSLGNKASADTAMRKLQSLMRNNVNTNYGNRLDLARELEQQGGASLLPSIAGQAMSSATPRGLQGLAASGAGLLGVAGNPAALLALPFQSPRLMGEAAYGLGRVSGATGRAANGLLSNPALANSQGLLNPAALPSLMTVAPSVAYSR
jgi:hypothetical protein